MTFGRSKAFEILCKQELIKKELLEAKENMDSIWASDDSITLLTTKIYESNQEVIESIVAKIISKIPYFAFASKIQIANLLENSLSLQESEVKTTDIKEFASRIFEMKKPVRQELSKVLSQRYGISIQNLKETPSLNSLKNSIVTIFESLARVSSKTVLKDTLKEFAGFLRGKSGVEVLDVNDFLHEVFTLAEYPLNENNLMQYMDFGRVADDVLKIGTVLKMIQQSSQPALGATPPQVGIPAQASVAQTVPQAAPTLTPGMPGQGVPDEQYPSDETIGGGGMQPQPNTAGNPVASAQMAGQDMAMQQGGGMEQQPNAPTPMDPNALVQQLSVLDQLLQDLQFQLGRAGGGEGGMIPHGEDPGMEGEGIPGEEGMEGEEGDFEGEEEGLPDEDVDGDGDEDIEYVDMTDEEGEESEEETPPKKKKENKPKE